MGKFSTRLYLSPRQIQARSPQAGQLTFLYERNKNFSRKTTTRRDHRLDVPLCGMIWKSRFFDLILLL